MTQTVNKYLKALSESSLNTTKIMVVKLKKNYKKGEIYENWEHTGIYEGMKL